MNPQDQWLSQKDRIFAWFRLGFAIVAVLVIQLNPSRAATFPLLSYASLGSFVLYSIGLWYITVHKHGVLEKIGIAAACFDLIWVSLIVFSTGGSTTPFFVYYFFPVFTVASRYGIKGGISAALAGVALLARHWREWPYMGTFVSALSGGACLGLIVSLFEASISSS